MKFYGVVRTVRVGELQTKKVEGKEDVTSITLTVASKRDYSVKTTVNGQIVSQRPTDFLFCMAYGNIAKVISDYCSDKDANGKLVSRLLEISGELRTYKKDEVRYAEMDINGDGVAEKLKFTVPMEHTVLVLRNVEILDSVKKKEGTVATTKAPAESDGIIDVGTLSVSPDKTVVKEETVKTQEGNVDEVQLSEEELNALEDDDNRPF